jgi:hypothetical protein
MFKWVALALGALFLAVLAWMVNDARLEIRRSVQLLEDTTRTVNEHLPAILDKTRKTSDLAAEHLPEIMAKARKTADTLAELAEDIRQLKELAGATSTVRDQNLVAYADGVLKAVESSGGTIGLKKTLGGRGLKNPLPAREWASGARKEALFLTVVARSKKELVTRLGKNFLGAHWYIQVGDAEPVTLLDWLAANHPPTREVLGKG